MSTGWESRLGILKQGAEQKVIAPLQTHGWRATIEEVVEQGEYLVIKAERGAHSHRVALMYTSATANAVYKALAPRVEVILIHGGLYKVESYAYGIAAPVKSADDFFGVIGEWNAASVDGSFALQEPQVSVEARPPKHRTLLAEAPIQAVWLRLRQLSSVTLAKKLLVSRAEEAGVTLDSATVDGKAQGLAFALRNAVDYFQAQQGQNVSQRLLNVYYGSIAFAFAEMLAAPSGPHTLGQIEESTKLGHGLFTIDGEDDGLAHLVVGPLATGFFATWMRFLGVATETFTRKKPKNVAELADMGPSTWLTVEQLFARIPEVGDLFTDIFESKPGWVTPVYDSDANPGPSLFGKREKPSKTYALFIDDSSRLSKEDIAEFPGPISEIAEVASKELGRHFRVAVDSSGKNVWWDAIPVHHSPFERQALIRPVFGGIGDYRAICIVLLYALSIVVRYRPSVWRRVQEGDLDHMKVLIEAFLAVVERVLPEQFLEKVTGQRVFAKQPGSLW